MNNKCSILVNSCDKFESVWEPSFQLLELMWPDCSYPIYLNTETKTYKPQKLGKWQVKTIKLPHVKMSWSKRLKECLRRIPTDLVFVILEDHFLLSKVDNEMFERCLGLMVNDKTIGCISFERKGVLDQDEIFNERFVEKKPGHKYRCNTNAAIWRKDVLIATLRDFESPWDWEIRGSIRSSGQKAKFYEQIKGSEPVFNYNFYTFSGYGLSGGKWYPRCVDLFKRHNIEVNFDELGFYEEKPEEIEEPRDTILKKVKFYISHRDKLWAKIRPLPKQIYWYCEKLKYKKYYKK